MKTAKRVLTGIIVLSLLSGLTIGIGKPASASRRILKGPSKDSKDMMTWDCVYFGNYPQSDATGQKKEPIKWRVLSVEGDDAFLVADQCLDVQRYNNKEVPVTWETCTVRSWLNGYGGDSNVCGQDYRNDNFIDRAFTSLEQNAIKTVVIENADNPYNNTEGGRDTQDKIFLLSFAEVTNPDLGFSSSDEFDMSYYGYLRYRNQTAYVAAGGSTGTLYTIGWWLRSPGNRSTRAVHSCSGSGIKYGEDVDFDRAIVPALHLKLSSSEVWTYAGTVCCDRTSTTSTGCSHENTELRGEKLFCTEMGYTGDTYCSDCGAKIKEGKVIPFKGGHQWNDGIITKQATETEDGVAVFTCTVCGETRTETIPSKAASVNNHTAVQAVTDESITTQSSEDVKGAVFYVLRARNTKLTDKSVTLKWNRVSNADGYKVYGNRCGKKNHYQLLKDVGKDKASYCQKKLKKGTYYKYLVAAYKIVDGKKVIFAVSKTIHAATTGGKHGVAKKVKVNKNKITLKKGNQFIIQAKEIKRNKPIKHHRRIAYESDNPKIAAVNKKGVVKAKGEGSCYIYVYAQNGVYKRVKVIVKMYCR